MHASSMGCLVQCWLILSYISFVSLETAVAVVSSCPRDKQYKMKMTNHSEHENFQMISLTTECVRTMQRRMS